MTPIKRNNMVFDYIKLFCLLSCEAFGYHSLILKVLKMGQRGDGSWTLDLNDFEVTLLFNFL